MSLSIYQSTIPAILRGFDVLGAYIEKAADYTRTNNLEPDSIIQARLAEDMHTLAYQVKSTAVHSLGAIEGVRRGVFSPDTTPPPENFAALKSRIAETLAALETIEAAEVDAFVGRDMRFVFGDRHIDFTAENFLLSFSQPNFYFHATTTYDILRWKGVSIGKRDFIGKPRRKK